ncbi:hypothetical protein SLOPH_862 [Spraguea lophii 42_110]|uniref:Uncharacterized protein n=1 Tax=Spraguea lophii (strain 42_110) TaxID=1358809 RepID=S7W8J1_SPRLO|nr:hypothetical protein SLOPH_862 [Spraguea lophii 42_110]
MSKGLKLLHISINKLLIFIGMTSKRLKKTYIILTDSHRECNLRYCSQSFGKNTQLRFLEEYEFNLHTNILYVILLKILMLSAISFFKKARIYLYVLYLSWKA